MPIDTRIDADAVTCRSTALWLRTVGNGAGEAATTVNGARTASEDVWRGQAADAFRSHAGTLCAGGDGVSEQAEAGSRALEEFAAAVDRIKGTMAEAREVAVAAGLAVVGEIIGDPVSPPAPLPGGGSASTPEQIAAHGRAAETATSQHAAYHRASTLAGDARMRYGEAQERLRAALHGPTNWLQSSVTKWVYRLALVPPMAAGALKGAEMKWGRLAGEYGEKATAWRTFFATAPAADRPGALREFLQARAREARAERTGASNRRWLLGLDRKPVLGPSILVSAWSPEPEGRNFLTRGVAPALRNVPGISVVATGVGTMMDMGAGRPLGSAAAKNVTQTGAGIAASFGAAAVAGLMIAGGPATLVGVGAGFAVSWAVGDNWDSIEGWFR